MTIQNRKGRERAGRQERIVWAAREMAEAEGWDAVTVRKLAERIEYSQPVLYSHFRGRDEIVGAVALAGFAELTEALRQAKPVDTRPVNPAGRAAVLLLCNTYLTYAVEHPAVYDAMFSLRSPLMFAAEDTPAPLREAFAALLGTLRPFAGRADPEVFTEVVWAALHGLVTLERAGRLPPERRTERLEVLVNCLLSDNR